MNVLNRVIRNSLSGIALLGFSTITACTADTDSTSAESTSDSTDSTLLAKEKVEYVIETGHEISGIAVIPATGHRGAARIAVAQGDAGARLFNFDGTLLWHDDVPAALVGFYQDTLIIFRNHEDTTRLDTYTVSGQGAVILESTAAPSPVAATTIQRTAFSVVGPVRLDGNNVIMGETGVEMAEPVSAFAAAKQFIPLTNSITHVFALESGKVVIREGE